MCNAKIGHKLEEQGQGFLTSATSKSGINIGGTEVVELLAGEFAPAKPATNAATDTTAIQIKSKYRRTEWHCRVRSCCRLEQHCGHRLLLRQIRNRRLEQHRRCCCCILRQICRHRRQRCVHHRQRGRHRRHSRNRWGKATSTAVTAGDKATDTVDNTRKHEIEMKR